MKLPYNDFWHYSWTSHRTQLLDQAAMCSLQVTMVPDHTSIFKCLLFNIEKIEFIQSKFMVTILLIIEYGNIGPAIYDENRRQWQLPIWSPVCMDSTTPFNSPVSYLGTSGSLFITIAL